MSSKNKKIIDEYSGVELEFLDPELPTTTPCEWDYCRFLSGFLLDKFSRFLETGDNQKNLELYTARIIQYMVSLEKSKKSITELFEPVNQ